LVGAHGIARAVDDCVAGFGSVGDRRREEAAERGIGLVGDVGGRLGRVSMSDVRGWKRVEVGVSGIDVNGFFY
jgi:hypothetical protein